MRIRTAEYYLWPLLVVACTVALWHVAVVWTHTRIFPGPLGVERAVSELLHKGVLWKDVRDSLVRVTIAYLFAVLCAIPTGILLGYYPAAGAAINPLIQILRPISPLAWIPLSIVWFGIGDSAAIFLIFMGAFFPLLVATMNAVCNVPIMFLRAGRNFGLSTPSLLRKVVFPAALPQIVMGLRISLGVAWLVVVAAEMIAIDSGLGYLIIDSRNAGQRYDLVVSGMLLIGTIGLCLDTAIRSLHRLEYVRWGFAS